MLVSNEIAMVQIITTQSHSRTKLITIETKLNIFLPDYFRFIIALFINIFIFKFYYLAISNVDIILLLV